MANHSKPARKPSAAFLANALLKRYSGSKNARCERLGEALGLAGKTVLQIANGGYCGERSYRRLKRMNRSPRPRRFRVYVPVPDKTTRDRIHESTPANERYLLLDAARD